MWYKEYANKEYTHEFRIDNDWYPCFIYHNQYEQAGYTTILTRNRTIMGINNKDLRGITR